MMEEVLMDPKIRTAPPKRKTRKPKRATVPIVLGKIQNFFTKLHTHKDCQNQLEEDGGDMSGMRKRKGNAMETTENPKIKKSRRLDDASTSGGSMTTSGTECPILLGAKSLDGREPDASLQKGTIGLDLMGEGARKVEWSPAIGRTDVGELHK